jgi:hypothetical protein
MTVKFKKIMFREDSSVSFHKGTDEFNAYVTANYIDTGKIISWRKEEMLDDYMLAVEVETVYRDQASIDEALADPEFKKDAEAMINYNRENLIKFLDSSITKSDS